MNTSAPNDSLDAQPKDSKVIAYLQGIPDLYFSDKGIENVSKRFHMNGGDLQKIIAVILEERKERQDG